MLRDTELLATTGETYAGWGPRIPRRTLDPVTVVPANEATAILYTYTPWVLPGRGGNWLMWNVWNRCAEHIGYRAGLEFPYNEGFIGASCDSASDCQFADALCESGVCTLACTAGCPDAQGHYAPTFCIDTSSGGRCLAQCTSSSPCDEGASCLADQHRPDLSGQADVCVPNAW